MARTRATTWPWDDLRSHQLWRPILMLSHILLVALVMSATRDDRLWNQRVDDQIPFPPVHHIYNCSFYSYSQCCHRSQQKVLANLYKEAQVHRHSLRYIDVMLYVSTLTVSLIVLSCLTELSILRKLDVNKSLVNVYIDFILTFHFNTKMYCFTILFYYHHLVNKISLVSYIICMFLLSHGVIEMTPTDPNKAELCGEFRGKRVPEVVEVMSNCYMKLGACRNKDTLSLVLVFMILYPFLCIFCYFIAGTISSLFDRDSTHGPKHPMSLRKAKTKMIRVANEQNNNLIVKQPRNNDTTIWMTPATSTNGAINNNPRTDLRNLLRQLDTNPSCRSNEGYLTCLALSFKNYVRSGYTPAMLPSTPQNSAGSGLGSLASVYLADSSRAGAGGSKIIASQTNGHIKLDGNAYKVCQFAKNGIPNSNTCPEYDVPKLHGLIGTSNCNAGKVDLDHGKDLPPSYNEIHQDSSYRCSLHNSRF